VSPPASGRRAVRLRAPAKINLGLRVLGAFEDGTHSVATIYQAIDLFDDVELALGDEGVRLSVHGQQRLGVPEGEDNLAARAAEAVLESAGVETGVEIRLTKRIPPAAGLGGGSSNAAAVLLGLANLLGRRFEAEHLAGIAAGLGADVPFFLKGGTAFGYHRGSHLLRLRPPPQLAALIVVPDVEVSTFWAYHAWDIEHRGREPEPGGLLLEAELGFTELTTSRNDFEPLVFAKFPEVESLYRTLLEGGPLVARLSGTGSACFALYRDPEHRDREADRLRDVYRNRSDYGMFRVRLHPAGVEVVE
jgi:4-diphosphocytidyl-2-C-methyl-D-erythritol kinase